MTTFDNQPVTSTMSFESLRNLLNELKNGGQPKADMCRLFVEQNILISIFSTLSSISYRQHQKTAPHFNHLNLKTVSLSGQEQNNNLYWAKGTTPEFIEIIHNSCIINANNEK